MSNIVPLNRAPSETVCVLHEALTAALRDGMTEIVIAGRINGDVWVRYAVDSEESGQGMTEYLLGEFQQ